MWAVTFSEEKSTNISHAALLPNAVLREGLQPGSGCLAEVKQKSRQAIVSENQSGIRASGFTRSAPEGTIRLFVVRRVCLSFRINSA